MPLPKLDLLVAVMETLENSSPSMLPKKQQENNEESFIVSPCCVVAKNPAQLPQKQVELAYEELDGETPCKRGWARIEECLLWGIILNKIIFSGSFVIPQGLKNETEEETATIFWSNIAAVFNPLRAKFIAGPTEIRSPTNLRTKIRKLREGNQRRDLNVLSSLSQMFFRHKVMSEACFKEKLYKDDVRMLSARQILAISEKEMVLKAAVKKDSRRTKYTLIEEVVLIHCIFKRFFQQGSLFPKKVERRKKDKESVAKIAKKEGKNSPSVVFAQIHRYFEQCRTVVRSINPSQMVIARGAGALQRRWKTLKEEKKVPFLFNKLKEVNFEVRASVEAFLINCE